MIYIFGAAFDPPHAGHSAIIRAILYHKTPEQIIIMPSGKRDDKNYHVSDEHRLAMLGIFVTEINDSIHLAEQDFSSSITEADGLCRNNNGSRVIIDDYFIKNWE
jgi:nicotinic acid mononucleotide adenylyltransferase